MKNVIAVDFDGTLCENRYPDIGEPITEVIRLAKKRQREGWAIILWTCRCGKFLDEAISWCHEKGLDFDAVNENIDEWKDMFGGDPRKVGATEYWDDRNVNPSSIELVTDFINRYVMSGDIEYLNERRIEMDYSKKVFEMLGVEPDEEFKLSNGLHYCLGKDLELWYRNPEWTEGRFESADYSIKHILNDTFQIIKLPKKITPTKEEQTAIDYAKLCGYKHLAKDKDGTIYAFDNKPHKNVEKGEWKNGFNRFRIYVPISFLSWQDEKPYYIGGDE